MAGRGMAGALGLVNLLCCPTVFTFLLFYLFAFTIKGPQT